MSIPTKSFSRIVVGAMRLGKWGVNLTTNELEYFIDQCVELGLVDFDHADIYGHYTEETHFGEVLGRRTDLRDKLLITTKCGIKLTGEIRPDHKLKSYDSTTEHIRFSVEKSLMELKVEQLELLLLHRPDYLMDPREVAQVFETLRSEGKVKHFGVSNFSPSQFDLLNSFFPLVTNQIQASILKLDPLTNGSLDQCLKLGIQPMAWSPLGGGSLFSKTEDPRLLRIQIAAQALAETHGATVEQVLLAWLLKHPSRIAPVVGTSKFSRVKSALNATEIKLSHEDWYSLLQASVGNEVP